MVDLGYCPQPVKFHLPGHIKGYTYNYIMDILQRLQSAVPKIENCSMMAFEALGTTRGHRVLMKPIRDFVNLVLRK